MLSQITYKKTLNQLRELKRELQYKLNDFERAIARNNNAIVNHKEIRVVGLKRTGNHAIINWIAKQHGDEIWHLNNIQVKCNPYRFLYLHYPKEHLKSEALGQFTEKKCLIYSYEDRHLKDVTDRNFEKKHDLYLGKSASRYDLIIMRDPFNLFASRFQKACKSEKANEFLNLDLVKLWIDYAKEYLGETNYLTNNKICVNYNQWCLDVDYRKQLITKLGCEFSDLGFHEVRGQGGGSSFEGLTLNGQADKMKVLERWNVFAENIDYLKMLDAPEILEYSEKIFGRIPETETILQKLKS